MPPYLRVVDESACENDWNSRRHAFGRDADAGVAHRERQLDVGRRRAASRVTVSTTSPRSVNFTALRQQVEQDLPQPRDVADDRRPARRPRTRRRGRAPSRRRARVTRSSADSTHSRRSNGCASMSMRPASIFEKSRMSLMIVSSASPRVADGRRRSRAARRRACVSSSRPLMPITAFIGVRISWLMVARNELFASLAASAAARACLRLVEQAHVLDRDHRLVGERLQQRDLRRRRTAPSLRAADDEDAERLALAQQRHVEHRAESRSASCQLADAPGCLRRPSTAVSSTWMTRAFEERAAPDATARDQRPASRTPPAPGTSGRSWSIATLQHVAVEHQPDAAAVGVDRAAGAAARSRRTPAARRSATR